MRGYILRALLLCLVVGVAAGTASAAFAGRSRSGWAVPGVLVPAAVLFGLGQLRRRRVTYWVTNRRLIIRTGLVGRRMHEAHLDGVLDVHVRQSVLDRAFGVGTVVCVCDTGGGRGRFRFRGVDDPKGVARTVERVLADRARPGWGYEPESDWAAPVMLETF